MSRFRQTGNKQLLLADDHLVIDSPYDAAQVTDTKRIPGARWDKVARVWRIPMTSLDAARRFAEKWDLWVDPAVLTFTLPSEAQPFVAGGEVRLVDDELEISFPYDQLKAESARRLPLTEWDPTSKTFRAPLSVIREVTDWAARFRIDVHPDVARAAADTQQAAESRIATSRSRLRPPCPSLLPCRRHGTRENAHVVGDSRGQRGTRTRNRVPGGRRLSGDPHPQLAG